MLRPKIAMSIDNSLGLQPADEQMSEAIEEMLLGEVDPQNPRKGHMQPRMQQHCKIVPDKAPPLSQVFRRCREYRQRVTIKTDQRILQLAEPLAIRAFAQNRRIEHFTLVDAPHDDQPVCDPATPEAKLQSFARVPQRNNGQI